MPFTINLATSQDTITPSAVSIEGTGIYLNQPFPTPGSLVTYPPFSPPPGTTAPMQIFFIIGNDRLGFNIDSVAYDDAIFNLLSLPNQRFFGGIFHATQQAGCTVYCSDGTSGINCHICSHNGITGRVCC